MLGNRSWLCAACLSFALNAYSQLPTSGVQEAALPAAEIFAPGVVSGSGNDGTPTFSPDGNTLFFTRSAAHWSVILESHRDKGVWSEPRMASFSGE